MCGRYTLYHHEEDLEAIFKLAESLVVEPRYNIAPSQAAVVVRASEQGVIAEEMRWGLIPRWVDDPGTFRTNLFNARSETAAEKPSFRESLKRFRCLVPASGFFEWQRRGNSKHPHLIRKRADEPLAFAGLYSVWNSGEERLSTFSILTTTANAFMKPLHDRMPVIVNPEHFDFWLDRSVSDARTLEPLLQPYRGDDLVAFAVGRAVGSPVNDDPSLIEPVGTTGG